MPSVFDDVRSVLGAAGFSTSVPRPDKPIVYFEDISIMGHVHVVATASAIISDWQIIQDDFLKTNADQFMRDTTKVWNLYTILLSAESPTADLAIRLFAIEDDFRGTRKIARGGIATKKDVETALAPILPLQNVLTVGLVDAKQRLAQRLQSVSPILRNLATGSTAESIFNELLGTE